MCGYIYIYILTASPPAAGPTSNLRVQGSVVQDPCRSSGHLSFKLEVFLITSRDWHPVILICFLMLLALKSKPN